MASTSGASTSVLNATAPANTAPRSKLPTSRLRQPAVSRVHKLDKENDGPPGKKVKPNEDNSNEAVQDNAKLRNPLLTRVSKTMKRKSRRSIGVKQLNPGVKRPVRAVPASSARKSNSTARISNPSSSARAGTTTLKKIAPNRPVIKSSVVPSASASATGQKKPAKWDYKGQAEHWKSAFQEQKDALDEQKAKASLMEDILRRLESLEGEKKVIQTQNTDLSGDLHEKEAEISRQRNEISRLQDEHEREIRTVRLDLEDTRRDLRKVRDERDELELQLRSAKKDNVQKDEKFSKLETEFTKLKNEYDLLTSEYKQRCETIEKQDEDLKMQEKDRKKLLNEVQELKGNIRVFCRVRPPLKDEKNPDHINYEGQAGKSLNVYNNEKECKYNFDKVFGPQSTQAQVYEELDQLVQSSLDGFNVCVFAYGQTGSGKTYTMEGPDDMTEETSGVIPRAMKQIFIKCEEQNKFDWEYNLCVEHVEIYCETLQDLLRSGNSGEKLEVRTVSPSGKPTIWVSNLSSHKIEKYADVMKLLALSKRRRATAATAANDHSSRSHSVFMLKIKAKNNSTGQAIESALNLIDLAGSERCGDNGATGQRLKEGKKINGSLTALSKVISALANKESHVPYRNSKLTHLLMNSLGGNSKTLMVVNINPSPSASSETVNTLRFATTVNQCNIGTAQKTVKF